MKKLLLTGLLVGLAVGVYGQGQINLDNIFNANNSPSATTNGLFFLQTGATAPVLINQDFNAAFYGGSDAASLTLIHSFSGAAAVGVNGAGAGTFLDPTGLSYTIAGATSSAFFQVEAWTGSFSSYAQAFAAGAFTARSGIFVNPVAGPPNPPPDLTGMPGIVLTAIPEPSTFALAGLGAAALLVFRRRK